MDWGNIFTRFPHLGRAILDLLDNKDQAKCRESSRGLKGFMDLEEITFKRILAISPRELDPLLVAAWFGQTTTYEMRSQNLVMKNPNWDGITALHWAAKRVDSSTLVKIDYVFLRKF